MHNMLKNIKKFNIFLVYVKKIVSSYIRGDDNMKLLPFNDFDLKTPRILEALNEASRSLAELKGFANSIPNQHILINTIT